MGVLMAVKLMIFGLMAILESECATNGAKVVVFQRVSNAKSKVGRRLAAVKPESAALGEETAFCQKPQIEFRNFLRCVRNNLSIKEKGASNFDKTKCFKLSRCRDPTCVVEGVKKHLEKCAGLPRNNWPELGPFALGTNSKRGREMLANLCPSRRAHRRALACVTAHGGVAKYVGRQKYIDECIVWGNQKDNEGPINWSCAQPIQNYFCKCMKSRSRLLKRQAKRCRVRNPRIIDELLDRICDPINVFEPF